MLITIPTVDTLCHSLQIEGGVNRSTLRGNPLHLRRVKAIVAVGEFENNPGGPSNRTVIRHLDALQRIDNTLMHGARVSRLDSRIREVLTSAHEMEEQLCWRE